MAITFTGTSTGNTYQVGNQYSMNGDVYTALRDGSFQNNRTGNTLEGSSNSPDVTWRASGNSISEMGGGASVTGHMNGSRQRVIYDSTGRVVGVTDGPGGTAPSVGRSRQQVGAAGTVAGRSGAVASAFSGRGYTQDVTDAALGYNHWQGSPGWSDSEIIETMYSDVGAAVYTPFKFGADLGHNLAIQTWGPGVVDMTPGDRVNDLGNRALDSFFGAWDSINAWGANQRSIDDAAADARNQVNDAWDTRSRLQAIEAQKAEGAIVGGWF